MSTQTIATIAGTQSLAIFGDVVAYGLAEHSTDPVCLERSGFWAVTQTFEGSFNAYRFEHVTSLSEVDLTIARYEGINPAHWSSSMDRGTYVKGVQSVREEIERGWVYQTNLCRVLSARVGEAFNALGLWQQLRAGNPAPYLSMLSIYPDEVAPAEVRIASASPELFLSRTGSHISTSPIKGTASQSAELLDKDRAENIMIVDLMRNDLATVCIEGSVHVSDLLRVEEHPTLVHLVSDVDGELRGNVTWREILECLMPPGSVSGAPKSSSLEVIDRLEPTARDIYCGAIGWVNSQDNTASLAVGIRTFWQSIRDGERFVNFGTGAGITWASNPEHEWEETELKARNLLSVAAQSAP